MQHLRFALFAYDSLFGSTTHVVARLARAAQAKEAQFEESEQPAAARSALADPQSTRTSDAAFPPIADFSLWIGLARNSRQPGESQVFSPAASFASSKGLPS